MKTKPMKEIREQVLELFKDKEVILFAMNSVADENLLKRGLTDLSEEERSCLVMSKAETSHFILQMGVILATDTKTRRKIEQALEFSYMIPSSEIQTEERLDGSVEIKPSHKEKNKEDKNNNSNIQ